MPYITPRLSLKVWNSDADPYDHEQLADNFLKIDLHDHSSGRGAQIGAGGIKSGAITTDHISPDVDLGLGSAFRIVASRLGTVASGAGATNYHHLGFVVSAPASAANPAVTSNADPLTAIHINSADYPAGARVPKLVLRSRMNVGTSPGTPTWTVGLYPTVNHIAANTIGHSITSVVTNTHPASLTNTYNVQTSAPTAFPTTGTYIISAKASGTSSATAGFIADLYVVSEAP